MKVTLTVLDRIKLPEVFPEHSGLIEHRLAESVGQKITLTAKEVTDYELRDLPGGRVGWDEAKAKPKEFEFEKSEIDFIKESIRICDRGKRIPWDARKVCEKFLNL